MKLLVLVFAPAVLATEPARDIIIWGGLEGNLFPYPCCSLNLPESDKLEERLKHVPPCSAGGPVGVFELRENILWLTALSSCGRIKLSDAYPHRKGPQKAEWLNGNFTAKLNWLCAFQNDSYETEHVYEHEYKLEIQQGIVSVIEHRTFGEAFCKDEMSSGSNNRVLLDIDCPAYGEISITWEAGRPVIAETNWLEGVSLNQGESRSSYSLSFGGWDDSGQYAYYYSDDRSFGIILAFGPDRDRVGPNEAWLRVPADGSVGDTLCITKRYQNENHRPALQ